MGRQSAIHSLDDKLYSSQSKADWFYFFLAAGGAADCPQEF